MGVTAFVFVCQADTPFPLRPCGLQMNGYVTAWTSASRCRWDWRTLSTKRAPVFVHDEPAPRLLGQAPVA